jgi:hypothetical protein
MRSVKAAFVSLLVRYEKAVNPDGKAGPNAKEGTLRWSQVRGGSEDPLEKLNEQWTQFMRESFLAIAKEEMELRRGESESRFKTHDSPGQRQRVMREWSN